ncbi:hypothetical protein M0804_014898 [Polistes exclamans]|nr:hypothetical protein M0804_014900 [Polistes exclamans]KAI4474359.1 hypothetical protein M0804_014898 [Polistes exclamans]
MIFGVGRYPGLGPGPWTPGPVLSSSSEPDTIATFSVVNFPKARVGRKSIRHWLVGWLVGCLLACSAFALAVDEVLFVFRPLLPYKRESRGLMSHGRCPAAKGPVILIFLYDTSHRSLYFLFFLLIQNKSFKSF